MIFLTVFPAMLCTCYYYDRQSMKVINLFGRSWQSMGHGMVLNVVSDER